MAKILGRNVPFLTPRTLATGQQGYYWVPSATLKRAGWASIPLGLDLAKAITAAEQRNEQVAQWKSGGATPKKVQKYTAPATVADVLRRFRAEHLPNVRPNTRRTYENALRKIEIWTNDGATAIAAIDRDRVRKFRDGLMKVNPRTGKPRHHSAHGVLRVGRTLFAFAMKEMGVIRINPFEDFGLATPTPRNQLWEDDSEAFFLSTARALGREDVAFAFDIALYTGQRMADVLAFKGIHWQAVRIMDDRLTEQLAGDDGQVMGFALRQQKTNEYVGIPVDRAMRARIDAAFAANRATLARTSPGAQILDAAVPLFIDRDSGKPWATRQFQRRWAELRTEAIERATKAGNTPLAVALEDLQFRDTRRTCVVRMSRLGLNDQQISAITGHKLETIKKILETYAPRDNTMAASAIVARLSDAAAAKAHREKKEQLG